MLVNANCKLFIHTKFVDFIKTRNKIEGAYVATKDGVEAIYATGNADVSARAQIPFSQDFTNPLPPTLCFYMANIDLEKIHNYLKEDLGIKR